MLKNTRHFALAAALVAVAATACLAQEADLIAGDGVQAGGGFVINDDPGVQGQAAGQGGHPGLVLFSSGSTS